MSKYDELLTRLDHWSGFVTKNYADAAAAIRAQAKRIKELEAERAHHAMTAGCLRTDLEYANARIAKLEAAVEIAKEYFYERQDVNWEGTAGNEQMKCLQEINEALGER